MQPDAFVRARRYLQYHRLAAWTALICAVLVGVLYVFLILLFGLFADLIVEKGQVILPGNDEHRFVLWLSEVTGDRQEALTLTAQRRTEGLGLVSFAWRSHHPDSTWYSGVLEWAVAELPWTRSSWSFLTGLLIAGLLAGVLRGLLTFANRYLASVASVEAATRLRRAVYHHTYRLGTLAFRALGPSEAVGVFTRNLEAVHEGLFVWLTAVYREPTKFFLLMLLALLIDPWLSIAFVLFAVLVWLTGERLTGHYRQRGKSDLRRSAEQLALLQESIKMMRLVKCYQMEVFNQSRVERQLGEYSKSLLRGYRGEAVSRPTAIFLAGLAASLLLYFAGWVILEGNLSVAGFVTIGAIVASLYRPVTAWRDYRQALKRARHSAVGLFTFLDRRADVGQVVGAEFLPPLGKSLEFDNVSLKEPGTGRPLLQGLSLKVKAGQRVALVGHEDIEKHALIYLIPRFLDPQAGEVRIDDKDIKWVTLDSLRHQVAVVLQHNLVFNDTVMNNIGCGDANYTSPQIIEAAKAAHAHNFIQKLARGYETRIGELGHGLSAGEQFRIALARAILREPALVIVEEPTTPLDDDTKAMLDDTLSRFLPGRTTLFLPHRLSTIKSCECIYLLHRGRVLAAGDHRELLQQSELYRHLQYWEFNVFAEQM